MPRFLSVADTLSAVYSIIAQGEQKSMNNY